MSPLLLLYDPWEASAHVEALVRAARSSAHKKADYYAAILDELKGGSNALSPSLIKGCSWACWAIPLEPSLYRGPLRFSRLSSVKSLGFKAVIVPASLGANALMSTVRSIVIEVVYQGISPEIVAADATGETLNVSMM